MFECSKCGKIKPTSDFWRAQNKRGHMSECKTCGRKRNKAWIASNRERYNVCCLKATHAYRRRDAKRRLFEGTKWRAKNKGLEFTISFDDLHWPEVCPVLGMPLATTFGKGKGAGLSKDAAPSIDRINNSLGYVPGNIIIVSWRANRIKSDALPDELRRIANFYGQLETDASRQTTVSGVQPQPQEEEGKVPLRVVGRGR
jgi:hypothetical protein